jgi:hypothetical protein
MSPIRYNGPEGHFSVPENRELRTKLQGVEVEITGTKAGGIVGTAPASYNEIGVGGTFELKQPGDIMSFGDGKFIAESE